jgi:hypothetical protein
MTYQEIKTEQVEHFIRQLKSQGELATLVKISLPDEASTLRFYQRIGSDKEGMVEFSCEVLPTEYSNDYEKIREYMLLTNLSTVVAWGFATQAGTWGEIISTVLLVDRRQVASEIPLSVRDVIADASEKLLLQVLRRSGLRAVEQERKEHWLRLQT